MSATLAHAARQESQTTSSALSIAGLVGIYFAFRTCITFLFFQAGPQTGAIVSIVLNLLLLAPVAFYAFGSARITLRHAARVWPFRFVLLFLLLTLLSLAWTEAQSRPVAFAYWSGLPADVALVFLTLRTQTATQATDSLFKGFVCGVLLLAIVAWSTPAMADLRIGNDDFLSPNVIGFECAFGALFCQYLAPQGVRWTWAGIALAITLLRSLSKTSIIVFILAEAYYLMRNRNISRTGKIALVCGGLILLLLFSGLLTTYWETYSDAGTQAETLTGRTGIWIASAALATEEPWLGHGFHSFHSVVPVFSEYHAWHAHNELLQQFFAYGVVGVALVIALYTSLLLQTRRLTKNPMALLTRALLLLVVVRGLVDTERFDLSLPLWAITAISLALAKKPETCA